MSTRTTPIAPASGPPHAHAPSRPWNDEWLIDSFRRGRHPAAERAAATESPSAWEALLAAGATEGAVLEVACTMSGCAAADLSGAGPDKAPLLRREVAQRYSVVPLSAEGGTLILACSNPLQDGLEQDLAFASARRVRLVVASPAAIRNAHERVYESAMPNSTLGPAIPPPGSAPAVAASVPPSPRTQEEPVVRLHGNASEVLEQVLAQGLQERASDIHLEPKQDGLLVRLRVDGSLYDAGWVPGAVAAPLVSRIKVSAGLDIADRLRPQDGRTTAQTGGRDVDLRISTLPLGGRSEKVVIRILDSTVSTLQMEQLGFTPAELHRMRRLLAHRQGLVLLTGPTGSGKTTTLYSALQHVRSSTNNVVTVEDSIEYRLEGINQVQVHDRAGLSFAAALRSILRQDPDVVLVGEIRDGETADIAIKASMTGHLVRSTLHTGDAPSAISRLADIGADLGALSGALKGIVTQRLVRRLCVECSQPA